MTFKNPNALKRRPKTSSNHPNTYSSENCFVKLPRNKNKTVHKTHSDTRQIYQKLEEIAKIITYFCHFCLVHVIWTGHRKLKLMLNVKYLLLLFSFHCGRVLQFGAHSRYYKGALTHKRSFLEICTTFRSDFGVG